MALPTARLVTALRETAARLRSPEVVYRWSHFGHCNCGHLAQTITRLPAAEIYQAAFRRSGDWGEQVAALPDLDFGDRPALDDGAYEPEVLRCAATGTALEVIFEQMAAVGLDRRDVDALEDLSDGDVLRRLGKNTVGMQRNVREDVVAYLAAWADLLEERLSPTEAARWAALAVAEVALPFEELPVAAEE